VRRALTLLAVLVVWPVSAAHGDADPASDTLLYANAHFPYQPNLVSKPLEKALDGMLKQTKAKGYNVKVAIIAAPTDLGGVPQMFTQPQQYADLLTRELAFNTKPKVLVVLPSGIGGNNLGDGAAGALSKITVPSDPKADDLARTAMDAVSALAKANGTPVPLPQVKAGAKRGGGGTSPVLTFGLPVLLVLAAVGVATVRGRRDDDDE
jgi:hypothetical protein